MSMKRSGFRRPTIERKPQPKYCRIEGQHATMSVKVREPVAMPKENALQHKGYEALVRKLACAHCGIVGFTQFCHSDASKGTGIKTDCRRGWPGCGPHFNPAAGQMDPGCHWTIGSTGSMGKAGRREIEDKYAAQTRETIINAGRWPALLPKWED